MRIPCQARLASESDRAGAMEGREGGAVCPPTRI
jgi:hypothetical protein